MKYKFDIKKINIDYSELEFTQLLSEKLGKFASLVKESEKEDFIRLKPEIAEIISVIDIGALIRSKQSVTNLKKKK